MTHTELVNQEKCLTLRIMDRSETKGLEKGSVDSFPVFLPFRQPLVWFGLVWFGLVNDVFLMQVYAF